VIARITGHFETQKQSCKTIVPVHSSCLPRNKFLTHGRDARFKAQALNNFFKHCVLALPADQRCAHFHPAGGIEAFTMQCMQG
jgi:hypothetical protein